MSQDEREGRFTRGVRLARSLKDNPKSLVPMLRELLLDVWCSRGGGFYGLGYIVAFVYYEIELIVGDVVEAGSMTEFAGGQLLELLFRLGFMSFVNVFLALLWPLSVLNLFGGAGIIGLLGAYLAFEFLLKPGIENVFPELKAHREQKQAE